MKELVGKGRPFYSAVDKAAGLLKRKVGTGAEFMKELMALQGIKQSEIAERGLGEVMGMPKMTHEQFMQALAAKPAPAIQEKVFGAISQENMIALAKEMAYKQAYEDLRDNGLSRSMAEQVAEDEANDTYKNYLDKVKNQGGAAFHGQFTLPGGENYREMLIKAPKGGDQFGGKETHFGGEPNILASMRLKDRLGPNGEKLLHLEELQSDWHQQGRKEGYKEPNLEEKMQAMFAQHDQLSKQRRSLLDAAEKTPDEQMNVFRDLMDQEKDITNQLHDLQEKMDDARSAFRSGVPDAPFKKNWEEMALKRLIHHAAEKGYHGIVVTPGAEQADRYSLAKHISGVDYIRNELKPQRNELIAYDPKGNVIFNEFGMTPEKLEEHIGKEAAQKLLAQEAQPNNYGLPTHSLRGEQLVVGGEGMKGFYDKKVPNILNAIGKKYGVKTQLHGHPLHDIPPLPQEHEPEDVASHAKMAGTKLHHFPITEQMRQDVLANGLPLHREGGIIHKAVGGQVQPSINQMRAELAKKTPTSVLDLSQIGANEAPSMNVKAYVPPMMDGNNLPVGGVSMGNQPLPVGGIDMSRQQGQQLMPANLAPPQGQQPQQGAPSPLSAGASSPAQQPPSNILQMTPQGQALNAMSPPQAPARMAEGGGIPMTYKVGGSDNMPESDASWHTDDGEKTFNIDNLQQLAKGGKIQVRPTVFDDAATRRNEKIEAAARALIEGEMKQKSYEKLVAKEKPVKPYEFIPMPATDEQAMEALDEPKKAKWRGHEGWPAGHRVGLRLDIPAYERHGVWVNSIHDESGGKEKFPTSYGPVSSVRNAEFQGMPNKAIRVATGEQSKAPFAKIMGELEHMSEEEALAHMMKYFRHKDYRQIGYDPRRHGDFYDRETMEPVTHAEHVVQIGPLVLAKKPKYGKREVYAKGGKIKQTVQNPQRVAYPGIYGNPAEIAALAASRVAPEDPILKRLFGVTRADMYQQAQGRKGAPHLGMLPGGAANPKGSMAAEGVMNKRNEQRLLDVMSEAGKHQSLVHGMDPWYYMDPLFARMVQLLGPQKAAEEYKKMNALMGMASSSSEVNTEIPRGSLAYWLQNQGRFNEFVEHGGKRSETRPADFGETPGHLAHKTAHALPMQKFLERGDVDMGSPKVPMYIEASGVPATGFQTRTPVGDAHWSRAVGLADTRNQKTVKGKVVVPGQSVSNPEMAALGPWWANKIAAKLGLESVPAQARAWGAFSPQTGVTTPIGSPKLELIAKQIGHTARRLGVTPETARDLVLTGKERMGMKAGGKVKVSTNMDTINLELSRRTKKAK